MPTFRDIALNPRSADVFFNHFHIGKTYRFKFIDVLNLTKESKLSHDSHPTHYFTMYGVPLECYDELGLNDKEYVTVHFATKSFNIAYGQYKDRPRDLDANKEYDMIMHFIRKNPKIIEIAHLAIIHHSPLPNHQCKV